MKNRILAAIGAAALGLMTNQASAQDVVQIQYAQPPSASQPSWSSLPTAPIATGAPANNAPANNATASNATAPAVMNGCGTGCGTGCCDDGCGRGYSIFGSAGYYFIRPTWESNPAFFVIDEENDTVGAADFNWDHERAPYVQFGFVNSCGTGGRIRGWEFDHNTRRGAINTTGDPIVLVVPAAVFGEGFFFDEVGDAFVVRQDLKVRNWDFEAIRVIDQGCERITLAAGLRYGVVEQGYGMLAISNDDGPEVNLLLSRQTYDGLGLVVGVDYERAIGQCGWSIYGNARGCLLWGKERFNSVVAFVAGGVEVLRESDDELNQRSIIETEIGAQYKHNLGRVRLVAQAGLTGMWFFEAGNASLTISQYDSFGFDRSNTLTFLGGVLRVGFEF